MTDRLFTSRELNFEEGQTVIIHIFYPFEIAKGDWGCRWTMVWPGKSPITREAAGIDALDALLRSLDMLMLSIKYREECAGVKLKWGTQADLGFGRLSK